MDILENILSQEVVQKLGWTLLHSVWQGGVVALLLAVLLRVLRKSSASLRYVIACLGLAVIVLLPVVTFYVVGASAPASDVESVAGFPVPVTGQLHEVYDTDMPLQRAAEYMQMSLAVSWKQRATNLYTSALPFIVFGWFIGVLALSLWHLGGWAHLQRLKRKNVNHVDASLKDKLHNLAERLKVTRPVNLMESTLVQIPTVVGWLRPVILMPVSGLVGLSPQQIEALLAHELGHIKRYDYLVNMLQTVVEILGFYHPAVWWISHKMRVERENCCDDLAVSIGGDKMAYARALTTMEEIRLGQGELGIAANGGNLFTRISRLVGYESGRKARPVWTPVVLIALLIIALAIPATLALTVADAGGSLRADSATAHVNDSVAEDNISNSVATHSASILPVTDSKIEIRFDCKIFEVPSGLKIIKGKQKGLDNLIIDFGSEYAERLEVLSRENKNVKLLASPTISTLDGKQATIKSDSSIPYTAGYETGENDGDEPRPITRMAIAGLELKIKGKTKENGLKLDLNINYGQLKPSFGVHKDDEGREIQVPVIESRKCATSVSLRSGETVIIGGLKSQNDYNSQLLLVITPSMVREEDTPQTIAATDIKDRDTYTVSLEIIGEQIRKLRRILKAQLASALAGRRDDKGAQVVHTLFKDNRGGKSSLVFHLRQQNTTYFVDYFYVESPDKAGQEPVPSRGKYRQPELARSVLDDFELTQAAPGTEDRVADKNPLGVVVKQINLLREVLNRPYVFDLIKITPHVPGKDVGHLSVILRQDGKTDGQLLFHLLKDNGDWFVDCIEFVPADQIERGLTLTTGKPTEQEPDYAHALEDLRLAQAYMQSLQQESSKSEQSVALEQLKTDQRLFEQDKAKLLYDALDEQAAELQQKLYEVQMKLEELETRKAELKGLSVVLASPKEAESGRKGAKSGEEPRYHTVREGDPDDVLSVVLDDERVDAEMATIQAEMDLVEAQLDDWRRKYLADVNNRESEWWAEMRAFTADVVAAKARIVDANAVLENDQATLEEMEKEIRRFTIENQTKLGTDISLYNKLQTMKANRDRLAEKIGRDKGVLAKYQEELQAAEDRKYQYRQYKPTAGTKDEDTQRILDLAKEALERRKAELKGLGAVLALPKGAESGHEQLAVIAAGFAERGNFAKAVEYQDKAIEFAKAEKDYGIGVAIEKADGLIRIVNVLPDTPVSSSSFQPGDIIKAIDGHSTEGMSLNEVVERITGPKGTKVTLTVKSHSQDITMEDTFTRQLLLGDSSAFEMAYQWYLEAYKAGMTFPQYFGLHRPHLNLPQYHEMFENYDVQLKDPNISTAAVPYIFKLKYANPEELAELLNRILQRRWEGIKDKPAQVIRFMPDPGRKRLIVLASPDDMQLIEALIAELDIIAKHKTVVLKAAPYAKPRQDTPAENTFTQIIKLQYTDCESLAEKLTTLFAGEPLRIVPHEHTNTLLVAGTESAIKKIKDVVAAIDVPSSKKELEIQY